MAGYIGDKIVNRIKKGYLADYSPAEYAPPRKHADRLARSERNLRVGDLRTLHEQVADMVRRVDLEGRRFADVQDDFHLLYPLVAAASGKRSQAGSGVSKGLQKVLLALLEAVENVGEEGGDRPAPEEADRIRGANLRTLHRFLVAFLGYLSYHRG